MSDLFHAFKSLFHKVTRLVCSSVYAHACVYTQIHSLNQILCCKTFRDNGECKNECTTWYYWIPVCTMLKTTAHQRILFLDKIIYFILSHIIPITDISFDNNIAFKTCSSTSHPCNTPTSPNIPHFIFHTVTFAHTTHAAMLLTLHGQVTLPYTLKHSYHWEILQIKVKDNKVNPLPPMMQTQTVSEAPITTFIVTWLLSQKHFIVCSTHENLKEEGRPRTPTNSCSPYWHSLWTTWRS